MWVKSVVEKHSALYHLKEKKTRVISLGIVWVCMHVHASANYIVCLVFANPSNNPWREMFSPFNT